MNNPYELSDRAARMLNRKAIRRFDKAKRDCNLLHFDELNVINVVTRLYRELSTDNKKAFWELALMVYEDTEPHGKKKPTRQWLSDLLESYDPVYLVIYLNEVERKRDRLIEGVIAASNKTKEFRRGLSAWSKLTTHELDRITDQATIKAFKDAGVKRVRWVTEKDERVCSTCRPRDGKVYDIDKVPPKPHIGCRCWLEPVKE